MRKLVFLVLALAAAGVACGDDDGHTVPPDAPATTPDAAQPDGPPGGCGGELSAFVIELVENQTRDDNAPAPVDDCTFTDAEDPAAFDSLF